MATTNEPTTYTTKYETVMLAVDGVKHLLLSMFSCLPRAYAYKGDQLAIPESDQLAMPVMT
jgi:hypothetical protein